MKAAVLCMSLLGLAAALSSPAGADHLETLNLAPEAEPHVLEGLMNIPPVQPQHEHAVVRHNETHTHSGVGDDGCGDRTIMALAPAKPLTETSESIENGENNAKYIEQRHKENLDLPHEFRHIPLHEIWEKETPCNCAFTVWQPVCGTDGHTYPTECFAQCVNVPVFVRADCKYVHKELWQRIQKKASDGSIPTDDDYEMCSEGEDDAPDPRPKCTRKSPPPLVKPIPYEEDAAPPVSLHSQLHRKLQPESPKQPQPFLEGEEPEPQSSQPATDNLIEYRVFNGMKVPYYTGEVANPCPDCGASFEPVCGRDNLTYPSRCFADCVGAAVARIGECDEK